MRRYVLIVCTDSRIEPPLLAGAVDEALAGARRDETTVVRVVLPVVLPATLPISAWPPGIADRLERLRTAVGARGGSHRPPPRIEVVACRSVAALLDAHWPVDALVLVGGAGWAVRRAARAVAADVTVVQARRVRRRSQPGRAPLRRVVSHQR